MPSDELNLFVEILRPALEERGWSVRLGAEKFKIPRATYHYLLSGRIPITPAWMGLILATLAAMDDIPEELLRNLVRASIVSQKTWCEREAEQKAMKRLDEIFSPLIAALDSSPSSPKQKKGHAKRAPRGPATATVNKRT